MITQKMWKMLNNPNSTTGPRPTSGPPAPQPAKALDEVDLGDGNQSAAACADPHLMRLRKITGQ